MSQEVPLPVPVEAAPVAPEPAVGATAGTSLPIGDLPGWRQVFELTRTFDAGNVLALTATPFRTDNQVTQQSIARVRVVDGS